MRDKKGRFVKGYSPSPKTQFKKGENLKENHPNWKGGKTKDVNGYIWIHCPNHPSSMHGYVYEHRLIIEKKIGRPLISGEAVHHINGIKDDNREENLVLMTQTEHKSLHAKERWRLHHLNSKGQMAAWEAIIIIVLMGTSVWFGYLYIHKPSEANVYATGSRPVIYETRPSFGGCVSIGAERMRDESIRNQINRT